MNNYTTTKRDFELVAKAYCERIGADFLFVSDDCCTFGFELRNGMFGHLSFFQIARELGIIDEDM